MNKEIKLPDETTEKLKSLLKGLNQFNYKADMYSICIYNTLKLKAAV